MKPNFNRRYTTIAIYAVLVVAISALIISAIYNIGALFSALTMLWNLLMPFVIGFVIAYIINPILNAFEKKFMPRLFGEKISRRANRAISLILTYLFTLAMIVVFFSLVIPQIAQSIGSIATQIPSWVAKAQTLFYQIVEEYDLNSIDPQLFNEAMEAIRSMVGAAYNMISSAIPQLVQTTLSVTTGVVNFIVGIIISIYVLMGKERFFAQAKKLLNALIPAPAVEHIIQVIHQSHEIFSGFISGKILDSCIIGLLCFIGMTIFRWPYSVLISVMVGVTNVIPYFGPFFGAIPSILVMLIVDPVKAIWLALFILALQQLDGNVIGPKILGDSTGLSAFWVIFSITVFGSLFGVVGMFIGVPLFAVFYSLIRQFCEWRLDGKGMPTQTASYASPQHKLIEAPQKKPKKALRLPKFKK
ncbi:MAG: AI-2E family transporter [Provencibacterium sp.]|nr:AI-2E family transporter [Provencibacterium sp.]